MDSDRIVVRRRGPLSGEVVVPGAKNSVLKLMAATLLADGEFVFTNVPAIADVGIMGDLLAALGVDSSLVEPGTLRLVNHGAITPLAPFELVERIRASINVLGPLLGRVGRVTLAMPGGDDFGSRPIDLHVKGLEAMGATFELTPTDVRAWVDAPSGRLHGAEIVLDFPSVGATENLMMAAVCADGVTTIVNAAREPEIQDLCHLLRAMGASIDGVGSSTLVITGVDPGALRSATHRVVPDRVQAATYIAALGVAGGDIVMREARRDHMEHVIARCAQMGVRIEDAPNGLRVTGSGVLRSVDLATLPYPGIATDYKPLMVTMLTVADGVGIVTENLYPGRFKYVEELQRLGADIRLDGHHAIVRGVGQLVGAEVTASDIRAGAALVVAGLAATGETVVRGVHHIDRGYEDLVGRLVSVGADIERCD